MEKYNRELALVDAAIDQIGLLLKGAQNKSRLLDELVRLVNRRNSLLKMEYFQIYEMNRGLYE